MPSRLSLRIAPVDRKQRDVRRRVARGRRAARRSRSCRRRGRSAAPRRGRTRRSAGDPRSRYRRRTHPSIVTPWNAGTTSMLEPADIDPSRAVHGDDLRPSGRAPRRAARSLPAGRRGPRATLEDRGEEARRSRWSKCSCVTRSAVDSVRGELERRRRDEPIVVWAHPRIDDEARRLRGRSGTPPGRARSIAS